MSSSIMYHFSACILTVLLLSVLPIVQADIYTKFSPVLQVNGKDYDRLITKSNKTSIVEFYAPWCGHCQNLKPAYEKAATNLDGLAKVAAVNCDDDENKALCGSMGVQGFPTLKIVRPQLGRGRPIVEDYSGPRTATGIVDAVVEKINNHVKRVTDKDLDGWLGENNDTAKAILFSDKGVTSTLLKAVAIDFLDVLPVAQVRNKHKKAMEMFGIEKVPAIILLPGGKKDPVMYEGEMKKGAIVEFLSQAATPNPDPAPKKVKDKSSKDKTAKNKDKSAKEKETTFDDGAEQKPIVAEPPVADKALPIPSVDSLEMLNKECLNAKSHTCVLALVPKDHGDSATQALSTLAELAHKHSQSKRHLFPFFEVSKETEGASKLVKSLELSNDVELIAVNARRGWWRRYEGTDFAHEGIESWIDAIRLSEGEKRKLPDGLVAISMDEEVGSSTAEATMEPSSDPKLSETATSEVEQAADPSNNSEAAEATPEAIPEADSETASATPDLTASADSTITTPKATEMDSTDLNDEETGSTMGSEPVPDTATDTTHDEL